MTKIAVKESELITLRQGNVNFDFDFPVQKHVVGVAYWEFSRDEDDHDVREISLSLNSQLTNSGYTVNVDINGVLNDNSNNNLDDSLSKVKICCIAELEDGSEGSDKVTLENHLNISDGEQQALSYSPDAKSISSAFISGFNVKYEDEHFIAQLNMRADLTGGGRDLSISSSVEMSDGSGNSTNDANATGTIDGGAIVMPSGDNRILNKIPSSPSVTFSQDISEAVVMLTDYDVRFEDGDHQLLKIGGGCSSWTVSGNTVTLSKDIFIEDEGDADQDSGSNVSLVVFGIPQSPGVTSRLKSLWSWLLTLLNFPKMKSY